jgi:hypothetical protein
MVLQKKHEIHYKSPHLAAARFVSPWPTAAPSNPWSSRAQRVSGAALQRRPTAEAARRSHGGTKSGPRGPDISSFPATWGLVFLGGKPWGLIFGGCFGGCFLGNSLFSRQLKNIGSNLPGGADKSNCCQPGCRSRIKCCWWKFKKPVGFKAWDSRIRRGEAASESAPNPWRILRQGRNPDGIILWLVQEFF